MPCRPCHADYALMEQPLPVRHKDRAIFPLSAREKPPQVRERLRPQDQGRHTIH